VKNSKKIINQRKLTLFRYFKRTPHDKDLISNYLKNIKFFKYFLPSTIENFALKIESKFFMANQTSKTSKKLKKN